jgi:hypothetical protein
MSKRVSYPSLFFGWFLFLACQNPSILFHLNSIRLRLRSVPNTSLYFSTYTVLLDWHQKQWAAHNTLHFHQGSRHTIPPILSFQRPIHQSTI